MDLNLTSVGHYSLDILPIETNCLPINEQCLVTIPNDKYKKEEMVTKIHRQFGHPGGSVIEKLLKQGDFWDEEINQLLEKIYATCKTCKLFSPTPPRPVVSLPAASEFNQVMTMDLKEVSVKGFKYILHMIDAFTRLTSSVFLRNKEPETILNKVMMNWVSVGFSVPKKCWMDNGGEFNNNTIRELGEALGCRMETGAGYAPWMNGLNERNQCG